ncbi:hypothetical protein [Thiosulfativibrio zosterae]|uniref:Uncharacterized protein n=1 Tax=Thiosulfativibrio zosterae TaxID=2675053 RepID=A0A6F8PQZ9_9GAMM|nr:hypothetical protein [Thiosulfativibrio zosterae]BBP44553.1 hypothetical protein THMIRHAT_22990 [Thiosulfativibrio zosterae]
MINGLIHEAVKAFTIERHNSDFVIWAIDSNGKPSLLLDPAGRVFKFKSWPDAGSFISTLTKQKSAGTGAALAVEKAEIIFNNSIYSSVLAGKEAKKVAL